MVRIPARGIQSVSKTATILLLMSISLLFVRQTELNAQPKHSNVKNMGLVKGRVVDFDEQGVEGQTLFIEGEDTKAQVVTDQNGEYSAELPAGIYQIDVRELGTPRNRTFIRAAFRVVPKGTTIINVSALAGQVQCLPNGVAVVPATVTDVVTEGGDTSLPPARYDVIPLRNPVDKRLNIVVEHCKKFRHRNSIRYISATMSYDYLTVYADSLTVQSNTLRFEAAGHVLIDDAGRRVHAKRAEVKFINNKPILALTR